MENTHTGLAPCFASFHVSCDAGSAGKFQAETDSVWVRVGQRVMRRGAREMWDSVAVESTAQRGGTLVVRVIIFNPDWDEPLQNRFHSVPPQRPLIVSLRPAATWSTSLSRFLPNYSLIT